jgi:hypothetical protein
MTAYRKVVKDLQDRIVKQVQERWEKDRASLTKPLSEEVSILADLDGKDEADLKAVLIRVWPPEGNGEASSPTDRPGGVMQFPVVVHIMFDVGREDALQLLREAIGVVIDGYLDDPLLNGLSSGPDAPSWSLGRHVLGPGEVAQEVRLNVIVEWDYP